MFQHCPDEPTPITNKAKGLLARMLGDTIGIITAANVYVWQDPTQENAPKQFGNFCNACGWSSRYTLDPSNPDEDAQRAEYSKAMTLTFMTHIVDQHPHLLGPNMTPERMRDALDRHTWPEDEA